MKNFTSVKDVNSPMTLIREAIEFKKSPWKLAHLGKNKSLGLIFLNPSLRTRLSTQKAARMLGMEVMVMNMAQEGWAIEWDDNAIMNGNKAEHIKDAAMVLSEYCDIIAMRCFPSLTDKEVDYKEHALKQLIKHSKVPVISLESSTLHPLQSFADSITIVEKWKKKKKPKVVLTWAPHIRSLPQAVANSFSEWMRHLPVDFVITHPEGYELAPEFSENVKIEYNQAKAFEDADFVYVKNWSSYTSYGEMPTVKEDWMLTKQKMQSTNDAFIMHCLPVRRNVELSDELMDSPKSLIAAQAQNRIYSAATVLKNILQSVS